MNRLIRTSLAAASAVALFTAVKAAEAEAGFIDIGSIAPSAKGEYVEVNLSPSMLKFAAKLASAEDHDAAELIGNLQSVRVNVVSLDDGNRQSALDKIESIRTKLNSQGWTKMVSVREQTKGDNVDIHVKQRSDDSIDGLVVTVIDHQGQVVIVNIVGNIRADQIGKLAERLDIEPLKKVHAKLHPQAPVPAPDKTV